MPANITHHAVYQGNIELAVYYKFQCWIYGMRSVEFLTCIASKVQSHVNVDVEPGANEGCWTC